ncbi:hypothetical protein F5Y17DRAFT_120058 [Xylariaceae sp. FL0594]|nr:hypothetical protein F5Y17DRAFT_120058 [Xylariaceae sp. FL0594]
MGDPNQQRIIDSFVDILTSSLNVQVERLSLQDEWNRKGPFGHRDESMIKFLDQSFPGNTIFNTLKGEDSPPCTSPFIKARWGRSKAEDEAKRDQGLQELKIYHTWVQNHVLKKGEKNDIILLPLGRPGPTSWDNEEFE